MSRARRAPSTKAVALGIAAVALVLAGIVSFYAASSPDGLTKVSEDKGFADSRTPHVSDGSPLAGYDAGLGNSRLSGGVAGVAGVMVVLLLASGVTYLARLRRDEEQDTDLGTATGSDAASAADEPADQSAT
ncbi:hypothetical protein BH11ACT8_BH11ACT8_21520 [soil metagenome]